MPRKIDYGSWAQVIGFYDLGTQQGSIVSMQPARTAFASLDGGEPRVRLKGLSTDQGILFDLAVNPLKPSCGVEGSDRMFEEFVPVSDELSLVVLYIDDQRAADFVPGRPPQGPQILALETDAGGDHKLPIVGEAEPKVNVSYLLQVRPEGDSRWHTMATGLSQPSLAEVDVNQFPGAKALDVRVLRSDGLRTEELFQTRRAF